VVRLLLLLAELVHLVVVLQEDRLEQEEHLREEWGEWGEWEVHREEVKAVWEVHLQQDQVQALAPQVPLVLPLQEEQVVEVWEEAKVVWEAHLQQDRVQVPVPQVLLAVPLQEEQVGQYLELGLELVQQVLLVVLLRAVVAGAGVQAVARLLEDHLLQARVRQEVLQEALQGLELLGELQAVQFLLVPIPQHHTLLLQTTHQNMEQAWLFRSPRS
jgi:ligand-binding SRPBCC domain-containing protein